MADDVVVEDRDVAAGGLDIQVAEQRGADVDGQAVVDQVGGEDPAEVVRGELQSGELRVGLGQLGAGAGAACAQIVLVVMTSLRWPIWRLEQEGQRVAGDTFS